MPMVNGLDEENRAYKFATLSIVGHNVSLVLGVEPVRERSEWDDNPSNQVHRVVRSLVKQAKKHVPVETVLCDREIDCTPHGTTRLSSGVPPRSQLSSGMLMSPSIHDFEVNVSVIYCSPWNGRPSWFERISQGRASFSPLNGSSP
jgi:hypothetical protein